MRAQIKQRQDGLRSAGVALVLAWLWMVTAGCSPLAQDDRVSECGGFEPVGQALTADEAAYCDAEVLRWRYDSSFEKLVLTNTRVPLNCCGEHSMTVHQEGETYVVTERDAPEQIGLLPVEGARCGCMCVFDYEVTVRGVPEGTIEVKLVRDVTDDEGGPETVWQGTIDLGQGQGGIVVDESDAEPWCSGEIEE